MKKWLAGLVAGVLASGAAQAALIDRGGGMLYDDVLNVTWLQDANYAKTSGYDADGLLNWSEAKAWAAQLNYGGYSGWRLASNTPVGSAWNYTFANDGTTDVGYNITSPHSELSYMFYVNLGLHGISDASGTYDPYWGIHGNGTNWGQADVSQVRNLQGRYYWSGTEHEHGTTGLAWVVDYNIGGQGYAMMGEFFYAWAVHDGDVAASGPAAAPEPATLALACAGLGLAGLRRRRTFKAS